MGIGMFSVKMVAASAAVFSSAVALRLAAPVVAKFLVEEAPRFCESVSAWLTPPYLYFVINGIIISIAATSRFQKAVAASDYSNLSAPLPPISEYANPATAEYIPTVVAEDANLRPELLTPAISSDEVVDFSLSVAETDSEEGFMISRSSWSPRKRGSSEDLPEKLAAAGTGGGSAEKPPVSTRLGRRRSIKSSPEAGKPLGVSRPKKHETLESTWRTITDGRPVPLARHLKKSDTWEAHARATTAGIEPPPSAMLKSETFSARSDAAAGLSSQSTPSGSFSPTDSKLRRQSSAGKLRREPSLGQDDLNRRVEAFIKKFNEEMRLQRQNSLQQYMDMINRSSR